MATEAAWLNEKKDGNNHEESTKLLPWIGLLMEGVTAIRWEIVSAADPGGESPDTQQKVRTFEFRSQGGVISSQVVFGAIQHGPVGISGR